MKPSIYLLILLLSGITIQAQTVILNVNQNYSIPETPTISQNGDTLKSSAFKGNQWYKDGKAIEGKKTQSLVIASSGNYMVTVTDSVSGCSSNSAAISVIKTDASILQTEDFRCVVYPNPNDGLFTVDIESDKTNPLILELLTVAGKSIVKKQVEHTQGKQRYQFGKYNLADGIYTLHVKFGSQTISRKLIVHK